MARLTAVAAPTLPRAPETLSEQAGQRGRLVSLDAFRGFVIAGMLLVNNVVWYDAMPRQLMHAAWNEPVTFTDMIFPWFLFAMGVAIPFSVAAGRGRGADARTYLLRVLRRAAILFALGLLVDSTVTKRLALGMGVLQLLALAYFVGAVAALVPLRARLGLAAALLAAHWALVRFVPIPGVGAGVIEEGRNIIKYLNDTYLARAHLSGVISVAPASALVLIGGAAGDLLRAASVPRWSRLAALLVGGAGLALAGRLWGIGLPLNKALWTSSYILFSGGLAALLLGVFYLVFDLAALRALAFPFAVFGANAIVVYVAAILFKVNVLQEWQHHTSAGQVVSVQQAMLEYLGGRFGDVAGAWIYTAAFILFWWLILLVLYRRRIFVRV